MLYILFTLLLFSCNDYGVNKVVQTDPELVVYPESIDFGHLLSGHESGLATFAVINAGDEELIISQPELVTSNDKFSLDSDLEENYTISPGETLEFVVYYEPKTFESNTGLIRFVTNDEDENQYELPVSGFGDAPVMTVTPETFDYGQISIGCDNEERITIRNDGNISLTIENITQMVTQPQDIIMEMGSLPAPPWELLPGQEVDFLVSYIPVDISYDESIIRIEGNDPVLPVKEVIQYGDGDVEHWYTQTHVQEEIALLDVIFVVDNSGSMNVFQQELGNQMSSFMYVFNASGADYHLAAITTDEARFIYFDGLTWIDKSHPHPIAWMQNVISSISTTGSGMEKGIEMAKYALEGDGAPGNGFYREDATMVIIYVSDEPDHSSGGYGSYTSFFDGFKASPDLMRQFAVIGDYPSGCQFPWMSSHRNVFFGSGYYHMTQRYNGDWYSICATDWGQQMQNLATTVTTRKIFPLDAHDPIEQTISVSVNGQLTNNWVYDVGINAVIFDDHSVPEPNQTITIEYAVWGCGDE
tara:strand:- start:1359 stop:2945 length:1587 start_codon:yes stop_codon:yes gene_type:complete